MEQRPQRTIKREIETSGIGFFTGADVTLRFVPAPPNHGIAFQRVDCEGSKPIPATIDYAIADSDRRSGVEHDGVSVQMIEHVMAAFAGLQIDNCLVELNAPEVPGFDGSSRPIVDCLNEAGAVEQAALRELHVIGEQIHVAKEGNDCEIIARPLSRPILAITYHLDYGPRSPIPPRILTVEVQRDTFRDELAFARTFIQESEIESLKAKGYGSRVTAQDLVVFTHDGVIGNELRSPDECVRHKILDCLGDLALAGFDIQGHICAYCSGHELNRRMASRLRNIHSIINDFAKQAG